MRTKEEIQSEIDTLAILESEGHLESRICCEKIRKLKSELDVSSSIIQLQEKAFIAGRDYKEKHYQGDIEIVFIHNTFSSYLATL